MTILVLYSTPPPRCHSVYSLTVFKVPKRDAVVRFFFHSFPLVCAPVLVFLPLLIKTAETSRRKVMRGMLGYLFSSASWRKVGGAMVGANKVAGMELLRR